MFDHNLIEGYLAHDVESWGALNKQQISAVLRYFSVDNPEYVKRVANWQAFLASGGRLGRDSGLAHALNCAGCITSVGWSSPFTSICHVASFHQLAMVYWKEEWDVQPDWDAYIQRVSHSGQPNLDSPWIGQLREYFAKKLPVAPSLMSLKGMAGSGACADGRNRIERWSFDQYPDTASLGAFRVNEHDCRDGQWLDPCAHAAAVPKNRKSCRLVASEHSALMYLQLGLLKALDSVLQELFGRRVPLDNAEYHVRLLGRRDRLCQSDSGAFCTVDLSDASDYVSMALMRAVLPTDWFDVLCACRSVAVRVPDDRRIVLGTFAPMGNGFCFRLLSLVVAAVAGITCDHPWSVYGDDAIIHRRDVDAFTDALTDVGLVVNSTKTCYGEYIESCGVELFRGIDITPWKPKRLLTWNNAMVDLDAAVIAERRGLPSIGSAVVANLKKIGCRWTYDRDLQLFKLRIPTWKASLRQCKIDDWPGLMRWFSIANRRGDPNYVGEPDDGRDAKAVPYDVRLRPGWTRILERDPRASWLKAHGLAS